MICRNHVLSLALAALLAGPALGQPPGRTSGAAPAPTPPRADALAPGTSAGSLGAGLPAIAGVTPNRAELASSAFTKLDAQGRGYLTIEDTRDLDGFGSAFRQGDQNGDGRLDPAEFKAAWAFYTGNVR